MQSKHDSPENGGINILKRTEKDKVDVNVGGIWVETVEEFIDVSLKLCQNKK